MFTPGFLGMSLSERWPDNADALADWRRMAIFYTACRGRAAGRVRVFPGTGEAIVRYRLDAEDGLNLSMGVVKLCEALFAGGATSLYPGLRGAGAIRSRDELRAFALQSGPERVLGVAPLGEHGPTSPRAARWARCPSRCPVDSYGRLRAMRGVHVNDASIIPDAPGRESAGDRDGAGPAQRPSLHRPKRTRREGGRVTVLVTGGAGWLGRRVW